MNTDFGYYQLNWIFEDHEQSMDWLNTLDVLNWGLPHPGLIKKIIKQYKQLRPQDKQACVHLFMEEAFDSGNYHPIRHLLCHLDDPIFKDSVRDCLMERGRFYLNLEKMVCNIDTFSNEMSQKLKRAVMDLMTVQEWNFVMVHGQSRCPILAKFLHNCRQRDYVELAI